MSRRIYHTRSCSKFRFRWIFCQFEFLRHCLPVQIRRVLGEMPQTLDETYERILQGIHEVKWMYARCLFQCVAVAARPLRVEELAEFLAFDLDVEAPAFRADKRPENPISAVLSTCSSFLAVVKRGPYTFIQFSHSSVIEYLTSTRLAGAEKSISRYHISMTSAHTFMMQACVGILLHLNEKEITRDGLKDFRIVEYAAKYWVDHARFVTLSANTQLEDAVKRLFDPRLPHLAVWLWIYNPTIAWRTRSKRPTQPKGSCLHYAAHFGFYDLIMFLLNECSPDVDVRGPDDMTALHWASRRGHLETAQVLLERGADVHIQDKENSTALRYALDKGHIEVARLLLEHGAQTGAQGMDGWVPFFWASRHGHVEVVRLLLQRSADPSPRDSNKSTPLHLASEGGHAEVVRVLLDYGAVAAAKDKNDASALHLASKMGHVEVVQLLLEHGADVNVKGDQERTPLHYALDYGSVKLEVARLLLEHGADTNAQGVCEWIPLHCASLGGYLDVAQLLLKYGANANLQNKKGWTPLHLASKHGRVEVARLLLERDIDASALNESKSTPLHLASKGGHVELARLLLLQHGVDPNAQDVNKWTPLHWASRGGHVEVARVLLQYRADAKAEDADRWTPLHLLSGDGEVEVARLFLGRSMNTGIGDMNKLLLLLLYRHFRSWGDVRIPPEHSGDAIVQDVLKWTRVRYSNNGNVELARMLLENGADASAQDKNNSTPLHWASGCGLVELARVLLEYRADPRAQDKDNSTPLHRVSESGQVTFVRILLQDIYGVEKALRRILSSVGEYKKLAELLLTQNADVGAQDNYGFSPLHLASGGAGYLGYGRVSQLLQDSRRFNLSSELVGLVRVLLVHGADARARDNVNSTPLHWASGSGYVEVARLSALFERGRLFGRYSNQGDAEHAYVKVAKELLKHGADANVQDFFGLTPLQQARRAGFCDIERLLFRAMLRKPYLILIC